LLQVHVCICCLIKFFPARRYASAVYAIVCPFVRPSISLPGTVLKRLNVGSGKQCPTIAQG